MINNHHIADDEWRLHPQGEQFPIPEQLKRAENDELFTSRWNELCIGLAEGCLTAEEARYMHELMQHDEATREQVENYRKLRLKEDRLLAYLKKENLKHHSTTRTAWVGAAAAAILAIVFTIYTFRNEQTQGSQNTLASNETKVAVTVVPQADKTGLSITTQTATSKKATSKKSAKKAMAPRLEEKKDSLVIKDTPRITMPDMKKLPASKSILLASHNTPQQEPIRLPSTPQNNFSDPVINVARVQGFLDFLTEKTIVGVNRVLNKETVVIKEFDAEGTLTYYAIHSRIFEIERHYQNKNEGN